MKEFSEIFVVTFVGNVENFQQSPQGTHRMKKTNSLCFTEQKTLGMLKYRIWRSSFSY